MRQSVWGRELASEGARAAAAFAFAQGLTSELVAYTLPANSASRRVMAGLGMQHDPADDFDHPNEPQGSPFCRHVLYRLKQEHLNDDERRSKLL